MRKHWSCPTCGPHVAADEDGCCVMCGEDCMSVACGCDGPGNNKRSQSPTDDEWGDESYGEMRFHAGVRAGLEAAARDCDEFGDECGERIRALDAEAIAKEAQK